MRTHAADVLNGDFHVLGERDFRRPLLRPFARGMRDLDGKETYDLMVRLGEISPGDIFVMSPADKQYIFGKVIRTDAEVLQHKGLVLVYVYDDIRSDMADMPTLSKENLLLPPLITSRVQWQFGYFKAVTNAGLTVGDTLSVHCFRDSSGVYHDEYNHVLADRSEPCGIYGVFSHGDFDNLLRDKLGIADRPSPTLLQRILSLSFLRHQ